MTYFVELDSDVVQARMAWAKKRGLSRWLWPDTDPGEWREAVAQLSPVLAKALTGQIGQIQSNLDPRTLSLAGYTSGTGPLLGHMLKQGTITATDTVKSIFLVHLEDNRERMKTLRTEAIRVIELLAYGGIRPISIKGMHTAFAYFPDPACRPVSDIDLVVQPQELERAEEILKAHQYLGTIVSAVPYQCDWKTEGTSAFPKTLLHVHHKDPWGIDLQTTLDRHLSGSTIVPLSRFALAGALAPSPISGSAYTLRQPLLLMLLAAHASEHLVGLTLMRLVELSLVIRKDLASGALDWASFLVLMRKIGPRYIYPAFQACERFLPGTIDPAVLQACEADTPSDMKRLLAGKGLSDFQALDYHSFRERHMWAKGFADRLRHIAGELSPGALNRTPSKTLAVYINRIRSVRHTLPRPRRR
jgi:hypothetical protein